MAQGWLLQWSRSRAVWCLYNGKVFDSEEWVQFLKWLHSNFESKYCLTANTFLTFTFFSTLITHTHILLFSLTPFLVITHTLSLSSSHTHTRTQISFSFRIYFYFFLLFRRIFQYLMQPTVLKCEHFSKYKLASILTWNVIDFFSHVFLQCDVYIYNTFLQDKVFDPQFFFWHSTLVF